MKKILLTLALLLGVLGTSKAQCTYTLVLEDSWGDGWNGASIDVWLSGAVNSYTLASGSSDTAVTVVMNSGDSIAFSFMNGGFYPGECSYIVYDDATGTAVYTSPSGSAMTLGAVQYGTSCNATCDWTLTLLDSWGDGWDGQTVDLTLDGTTTSYTLNSGYVLNIPISVSGSASLSVDWQGGCTGWGCYDSECSYSLSDPSGNVVYTSASGTVLNGSIGTADTAFTASCASPGPCTITSFPYDEGFETWATAIPSCVDVAGGDVDWTVDNGTTPSSSTGPSGAANGTYFLYTEASGPSAGDQYILDLPPMDLTVPSFPQLKFAYHKYGSTMGDLHVMVSQNNGFTFDTLMTIVGQVQTAMSDPWQEDSVSLSQYVSSNTLIRFVGVRGSNYYSDMAIDDIHVGDGPSCTGAYNVNFANVGASGAEMTWTSSASTWDIEYGPSGFVMGQGTGTYVDTVSSPYTFTGLSSSTSYDVWILDSCGNTQTTQWKGPFTFTTTQGVYALPYFEDFESGNGEFYTGGSSSSWEHGAVAGTVIPSAYSGTSAWVTNLDGTYNNSENSYVYFPYMDGTSATFDLVFDAQMAIATENNYDESWVEYSFDDITWTKLLGGPAAVNWYNDLGNNWWEGDTDPSWKQRLQVIPNSAGELVHIRVAFSSDGSVAREGVGIDDAQVYEIPCEFPVQNLAVSNVTSSSFDVHWTSNASTWEIETGPIGYGQATGVGTIVTVNSDTNTIAIPACDSVDLYVRAVCGATNSPWVGPITVGALCEYDVKLNNLLVDVNTCGDSATTVYAVIENKGLFDVVGIPVHTDITGGLTASLSNTYSDTLVSGASDTLMVGTFNSYNGAIGVDIFGYTALTTDQYSTNDSIVIGGVAYIGPTPVVADIDTVCSTDATGTFYAEHIDGLRYGWYASTTDTIAAGIGDSFTIPMSGQLTWYLGYEKPLGFHETNVTPNNGLSGSGSGVAFSVEPVGNAVTITGFEFTTYAAVGASFDVTVAYMLDELTTANFGVAGTWVYTDTITVVSTGLTFVQLNTPIVIPAGVKSSLKLSTTNGMRYISGSSFGSVWYQDNMLTTYQGVSFSNQTGSPLSPRNFSGRIYYDSGDKCSETRIPVTMGIYADTAQADFTYTILADGYTVFFDATNSVADEFMWDFNDGTVGYGDTITHTFADSVDAYEVCLFVDDTVCMTSDMMCDAVVTTIGLEESMLNASLNIFPNPTAGAFNIEFTAVTNTNYSIEILDVSGRAISTKTGETQYGKNNVQMNASLANGVYMIKTIVGDQVNVSRLVVRH